MVAESKAAFRTGLTGVDISGELADIFARLGFDTRCCYPVDEIYNLAVMDKKIFGDNHDYDLDDSSSSEYVISINTNMKMMNMRFSISRSEIHYLFPIHTFFTFDI